jgi:hypothetical protein
MSIRSAKILLITGLTVFLFGGCKKSASYDTKPQINFKNINSTSLKTGDLLLFEINFTDKEGDIQDTLWVQKISKTCPNSPGVQFISPNKVPDFTPTPNLAGILEIGFAYNANVQGYPVIGGCSNKNDTATFKFWLRDKGKNISDTLVSPPIILQR